MIRLGIIGCGRISDLHLLGYKGRNDAKIVAVCDSDRDLAVRRREEWGADRVYTDYKALLADKEIDAVEILTPQPLHEEMVLAAIEQGKHIQLQKPMSIDRPSADRICKALGGYDKVFQVGDNYIQYPPFRFAKEIIESGTLGEPTGIHIGFIMGGDGGWEVPPAAWQWRIREMAAGRGFNTFDHGHHLYAIADFFLGRVEKVSAWVDSLDGVVDSPATVMWKYRSGRRYGILDFQTAPSMHIPSEYYANDESVRITCEKGIIFVHRCTGNICTGPAVSVFDGYEMKDYFDIESDWSLGFVGNTRNFIESIQGKAEPNLSAQKAREVLTMALAVARSSELRRTVYMDEFEHPFPSLYAGFRNVKERREIGKKKRKMVWENDPRRLRKYQQFAPQAEKLTRELLHRFDRRAASGWNCSVGLILIQGVGGGGETRYTLKIVDGEATLKEGEIPESPDLLLRVNSAVWAAVLLGKKKMNAAVFQGLVKFEGRTESALRVKSVFSL